MPFRRFAEGEAGHSDSPEPLGPSDAPLVWRFIIEVVTTVLLAALAVVSWVFSRS